MITIIINMCGIFAFFAKKNLSKKQKTSLYDSYMKSENRGPDVHIYNDLEKYGIIIGFHRLAIMDTSLNGDQPFKYVDENREIYVACNGEIYNHHKIIKKFDLTPKSKSDCEVLPLMYVKFGIDKLCETLNGEYSFLIVDINKKTKEYVVYSCNDRFGIRPLFFAEHETGYYFTSELKSMPLSTIFSDNSYVVERHPPRTFRKIQKTNDLFTKEDTKYYSIDNIKEISFSVSECQEKIKKQFIKTIRSRLESHRKIGALLSGGVDSSLVCSVAQKVLGETGQVLNTFSIGLPGSTDKYYAELVAKFIGSNHTHVEFTQQQFFDCIKEVIKTIETFDITTIRASVGQYLISKWISENTDIKVLLCGDGSDELCAGYMYFHKAPSKEEMHDENIRLLSDIHLYDGLRADRCVAGHGIELRVPFLDHKFVDLFLSLPKEFRMPSYKNLEKWLLRSAFDNNDFLPSEVLMRKKVAFSDSVSSQGKYWYQMIQDMVDTMYSGETYSDKIKSYTHLQPHTKESLYYRELFTEYFGSGHVQNIVPYYWLPKWCGDIKEPSATVLDVFK